MKVFDFDATSAPDMTPDVRAQVDEMIASGMPEPRTGFALITHQRNGTEVVMILTVDGTVHLGPRITAEDLPPLLVECITLAFASVAQGIRRDERIRITGE